MTWGMSPLRHFGSTFAIAPRMPLYQAYMPLALLNLRSHAPSRPTVISGGYFKLYARYCFGSTGTHTGSLQCARNLLFCLRDVCAVLHVIRLLQLRHTVCRECAA